MPARCLQSRRRPFSKLHATREFERARRASPFVVGYVDIGLPTQGRGVQRLDYPFKLATRVRSSMRSRTYCGR